MIVITSHWIWTTVDNGYMGFQEQRHDAILLCGVGFGVSWGGDVREDWQRKYNYGQRFRTNPHIKNMTVVIRIKLGSKVQIVKYKIEISTIKFMFNVLWF